MSAVTKLYITESDYLEQERLATHKSEYYQGEIFAMAGATKEHNKVVANIIGELHGFLKGKKCDIFPSDIRVYNELNTLYTYPDIVITCGEEKYLDDQFDTLLNPTIIIEVLSASTENYDTGIKFRLYRSLPSLQHYITVSSMEYAADVFTRDGENWILSTAKGLDGSLHLSAIDYTMQLKDIYAQLPDLEKKQQ
jgi:Uma2 family endonuclease